MNECRGFAPRYDVIVVGARCAGASTAMLLARAGAKVLLVDRQKYGSDTASTHALLRGAVLHLKTWGLLPSLMAAGTPMIRKSTFHYGPEAIRVDIRTEYGVSYLAAPRRTVLDRLLVDTAREAGVDVRHGTSLAGLRFGAGNRVVGVTLKDARANVSAVDCDLLIGADGRQSTVARQVGAKAYVEGRNASGYVYGYFAGMSDDGYHWYFEDNVAAGVIPTNGNQHCVFAGVPRERFADTFRGDLRAGFLRTAAANSAVLREWIEAARPVGQLRGFACTPGYLRQSWGPGWALVGDAGYFKDPLTAHGITDALRDAELLSRAVRDGRAQAFAHYQDTRDALSRPLLEVTDEIASFDWTLDEVRTHHAGLSAAMKAETDHIARRLTANCLAA